MPSMQRRKKRQAYTDALNKQFGDPRKELRERNVTVTRLSQLDSRRFAGRVRRSLANATSVVYWTREARFWRS